MRVQICRELGFYVVKWKYSIHFILLVDIENRSSKNDTEKFRVPKELLKKIPKNGFSGSKQHYTV